METQNVQCIKCKKSTTSSEGIKTTNGYLCPDCAKKQRRRKTTIGGIVVVAIITGGITYFLSHKGDEVAGFAGVDNVQEQVNVDVQKREFSLTNVKAAPSTSVKGSPIDNIESFKKAFAQAVQDAENVYYAAEDNIATSAIRISIPKIASLFTFNSAELSDKSLALIKEYAAAFIKTDKTASILVEGYACNIGTDDANDKISAARATAVKNALVNNGVPSDRIITRSYGKRQNNTFNYASIADYRRATVSIQ